MAITIDTAGFSTLTAQPFGYEETDTKAGRTARSWEITGLLTPSEWLDLLEVYDNWRATRITDEDSAISGTIGTTVSFSGDGPGGQSWTNIECWFSSAPSAERAGAYLSVSLTVVDANEALESLLREQDIQNEDLPNFGTIEIGDTELILKKPVDGFTDGAQLQLTSAGVHYTEGPLVAVKIKDVEGTTDMTGWNSILSWYEGAISASPIVGEYYPTTPPTVTAENKIVNGIKTIVYTVSIQLVLIM